jgi:peptidylprolyl isomerase
MKVENGHNVHVHYKGTLRDGTVFDNSRPRGQAVKFKVGAPQLIAGFSDAIVGMKAGETKSITLSPEEAYGPRDPKATKVIPKEAFEPDFEFIIGGMIQGKGPRGPFLAKIQEVADTEVTLDLNHPLAGQELNFEIEVVSIETDSDETDSPGVPVGPWSASMKKAQLLALAKACGLSVNTRSTKAQIIEVLQAAR